MRGFWYSNWGKFALVVLACVFALALCEIGFRIFAGPSPYLSGLELGHYPDNPRGYFDDMDGYFSVLTDPSRHQCQAPVDSTQKQVLFLGDSFMVGVGVRTPDTLSSRLRFEGMQQRNCAVIGRTIGGVLGDLNRVKERLDPHILVYGMVLNDLGPGGDQEAMDLGREHGFSPCRFRIKSDVVLESDFSRLYDYIFFDTNLFKDYLDARTELAFGPMAFLLHSRMVSWFYEAHLQADIGAHTDLWYRHCFARGPRLEAALDLIVQMKGQADHFIVMLWPLFVDLESYPFTEIHGRIREGLAKRNVEVLDLLDVFKGQDTLDLAVHAVDRHPNDVAHDLAAKALKERLDQLNWATTTLLDR